MVQIYTMQAPLPSRVKPWPLPALRFKSHNTKQSTRTYGQVSIGRSLLRVAPMVMAALLMATPTIAKAHKPCNEVKAGEVGTTKEPKKPVACEAGIQTNKIYSSTGVPFYDDIESIMTFEVSNPGIPVGRITVQAGLKLNPDSINKTIEKTTLLQPQQEGKSLPNYGTDPLANSKLLASRFTHMLLKDYVTRYLQHVQPSTLMLRNTPDLEKLRRQLERDLKEGYTDATGKKVPGLVEQTEKGYHLTLQQLNIHF